MAPNRSNLQPAQPNISSFSHFNMSSPTSTFLLTNSRSRSTNTSSVASMKTLLIGKDQHPINIMTMVPVTDFPWKKRSCFDSLRLAVNGLTDSDHNVADIITAIGNELPISTGAALQEADAVASTVSSSIFHVENIYPDSFVSSKGNDVAIDITEDISKRQPDITFFRCRSHFNARDIDERITNAGSFSCTFCLRLPYHSYNSSTGEVTPIVSATTPPTSTMNSITSTARQLQFSTPTRENNAGSTLPDSHATTTNDASNAILSPRMLLKFGSTTSTNSSTKFGYFGDFSFLDSQENFNKIFGRLPSALPASPLSKTTCDLRHRIQTFAALCRLEVFLHICELNYVGANDGDTNLGVIAICEAITGLRQGSGTPDDLFNSFIDIATSLPEDVSTWTMNLGSTYFGALRSDVRKAMSLDKTFKLPTISTQISKPLQLDALREIRLAAVTHFSSLQDNHVELQTMVASAMQSFRGSHRFHTGDISSTPGIHGNTYFQQQPSLAESTMQKYKGSPPGRRPVPTKKHPETGLEHPYDMETSYLSRYPLGFRGCFACGGTDHFDTRSCPLKRNGQFNKQTFMHELWAHKPWTRRRPTFSDPSQSNQTVPGKSLKYSPVDRFPTNSTLSDDRVHLGVTSHDFTTQASKNGYDGLTTQLNNVDTSGLTTQKPNLTTQMTGGLTTQTKDVLTTQHSHTASLNNTTNTYYGPKSEESSLPPAPSATPISQPISYNSITMRNVDNTPAWLQRVRFEDDEPNKKARLCVFRGQILSTLPNSIRSIPLAINNNMPAIELRFGTSIENEITILCHLDTCGGMNTGSLLLHQWIMTTNPAIVSSFEQYNDPNPFQPLSLDTAVPTAAGDELTGKLTAVAKYFTRYGEDSEKPVTIEFGLGPSIQVNAIIALPTILAWGLVPDVVNGFCYSYTLKRKFKIHFDSASKGLPVGVDFAPTDFQRPSGDAINESSNIRIQSDEDILSNSQSASE